METRCHGPHGTRLRSTRSSNCWRNARIWRATCCRDRSSAYLLPGAAAGVPSGGSHRIAVGSVGRCTRSVGGALHEVSTLSISWSARLCWASSEAQATCGVRITFWATGRLQITGRPVLGGSPIVTSKPAPPTQALIEGLHQVFLHHQAAARRCSRSGLRFIRRNSASPACHGCPVCSGCGE